MMMQDLHIEARDERHSLKSFEVVLQRIDVRTHGEGDLRHSADDARSTLYASTSRGGVFVTLRCSYQRGGNDD